MIAKPQRNLNGDELSQAVPPPKRRVTCSGLPLIVGFMLVLAGCAGSNIDFSQPKAVEDDISATYDSGPTSLYPGKNLREEPDGAHPWNIR